MKSTIAAQTVLESIDGGAMRRLVNGSFLSVFISIVALVVLYRDE